MLRWLLIFIILPSLAFAQSYLIEPSLSACQTRAAAQCAALGCDGVKTQFWWSCQVLASATATGGANGTGGSTALTIQPGTPFDVSATNRVAPNAVGLSTAEQSAVQTMTQLGTALPYIISEPSFLARFTALQISAMASNGATSAGWTAVKGGATVNLNAAAIQTLVATALAQAIITAANAQTILAPQAPIANP